MLLNPELYLMVHREKIEQIERKNRYYWQQQPVRRSWKLPKLRHLLFFW